MSQFDTCYMSLAGLGLLVTVCCLWLQDPQSAGLAVALMVGELAEQNVTVRWLMTDLS